MITLADLAALQNAHGDDWAAPVAPVVLDGPRGSVVIGDGPVTLMGCVNLSRDSTYRESVATSPADAVRIATGADVDVPLRPALLLEQDGTLLGRWLVS